MWRKLVTKNALDSEDEMTSAQTDTLAQRKLAPQTLQQFATLTRDATHGQLLTQAFMSRSEFTWETGTGTTGGEIVLDRLDVIIVMPRTCS
nr:hypothetical protein BgiMline_027638 [Biomphalaria glabrata]